MAVNWLALLALVPKVEADVKAVQAALTIDDKAAAFGALAIDVVTGAEAVTGKALVDDAALAALVEDVKKAIKDAENLKPKV